jgi:predicted transcriptional regulator
MTLRDVTKILEAEVLCGEELLDREVGTAFACDLISEMLAFAGSQTLLITSLTNPHIIHTAGVMDAVAVIFTGDKKPDAEVIKKINNDDIPLLSTPFLIFKCCGLLFSNGVEGCIRGSTQ